MVDTSLCVRAGRSVCIRDPVQRFCSSSWDLVSLVTHTYVPTCALETGDGALRSGINSENAMPPRRFCLTVTEIPEYAALASLVSTGFAVFSSPCS